MEKCEAQPYHTDTLQTWGRGWSVCKWGLCWWGQHCSHAMEWTALSGKQDAMELLSPLVPASSPPARTERWRPIRDTRHCLETSSARTQKQDLELHNTFISTECILSLMDIKCGPSHSRRCRVRNQMCPLDWFSVQWHCRALMKCWTSPRAEWGHVRPTGSPPPLWTSSSLFPEVHHNTAGLYFLFVINHFINVLKCRWNNILVAQSSMALPFSLH